MENNNATDNEDLPITIRMFCGCPEHGEMICVGVVFPVFEGMEIQYLCECTKCGAQQLFPIPFPMAIPISR